MQAEAWLKLSLLLKDTCQSTRLNLVIHAPCPDWMKWGWKARFGNWRKWEPNRTACISIVRLISPQSRQRQGSVGRAVFQHTCTLQCTPVCFNIGRSKPTSNKTTESVDTVLCTQHSDGKTNKRRRTSDSEALRTQIAVRLTQADAADANWIRTSKLTFRHRASCILGQAFHYSPKKAFYIFNQQIYFIIWYLLERASLI